MRRALRWSGWLLAGILGLPVVALVLALWAANSPPGWAWIERSLPGLTGGKVGIAKLEGRFPDALRIGHIEIRDAAGVWLALDDLALDWSPVRLLAGYADIQRLEAGRIALSRRPLPAPEPQPSPKTGFSLPVGIDLHSLRVGRLELAPPVAGVAAALGIEGSGRLSALDQGEATLAITRLDGAGRYALRGRIEPGGLHLQLEAKEPPLGLLAHLAHLPELGALSLDAGADGPYAALNIRFGLEAGPLRAGARGTIDLEHNTADLALTAAAPALRPRPEVSWQSVALDAKLHGPFIRPTAQARLDIAALEAAGTAIPEATLELQGDAGALRLQAVFKSVRIPGPHPDILRAAPLVLAADARLDAPERPVKFSARHPLLTLEGQARTGPDPDGTALLKLPDLSPWAALGGVDLRGSTELRFRAAQTGATLRIDAEDKLALTGGMAPLPALVGTDGKIGLSATLRGPEIAVSRLRFDGKALTLAADGVWSGQTLGLNWKLNLPDLAALAQNLAGRAALTGRIDGAKDDLALVADMGGELAAQGLPRGPVSANIRLQGLPRNPAGQMKAQGMLNGSPLQLALTAQRGADGVLRVAIDRADWKSAHAEGTLSLSQGAALPLGKIDLRMTRLEDLRPWLGQPLTGSLSAGLDATEREARLRLDARDTGLTGTAQVEHAALALTLDDPLKHPRVEGSMTLDGIEAGAVRGSARLTALGPLDALDLGLSSEMKALAGADAQVSSALRLDIPGQSVRVSSLETRWKRETLRLLQPARIGYGKGLSFEGLRLGLRGAVLEAEGRAAPTLDLEVALRDLPADLVGLFVPGLALDGALRAEAHLSGSPARPLGTLTLAAQGVHPREGAGRVLPPVNLATHIDLAGTSAEVDSRMQAGTLANLAVTGRAPLVPGGEFDLRASGDLDLKILDPLLMAEGHRVRGRTVLNAALSGTPTEPRAHGSLQWSGGEVQDFAQGMHISDITALLLAEGDSVRIAQFQGRAGPGTLNLAGRLGVLAEGFPIDLKLTARNAQPLASDRLTVNLNADLGLQGHAAGTLDANGTLRLQRVEIRVPETMPASIAVLDVRRPGQAPPPPPKPGPRIGLDLLISAPSRIFVRGRGLDAELGGTVRLRGDSNAPHPEGRFELRRGEFSLAGKTLTFDKGVIGFNGGNLADPTLDFAASSTNNSVTATLGVTGTARKPKITLSSVPELPPDEVLAQLLFGHATASLNPFEMVQIASAVVSLTGVTAGAGSPLETVRKGLGLDRLALGGSGGSPGLEAGRYVAPGVFVGAKQGFSGNSTQATVQIDIAKGLKVEGSAGTGSTTPGSTVGTNSVGLIYQIEY
ncbi:autotransporter secretion inner membrane protein TamB [Methylomagnum ishizawai]|uniref:Autotransporter secretion inner membrane protein TamB n=1 Tax=Methylomagnum ishizawai TaxID=1760988 RepID=A0A1Y6CYT9_9GAMM|nr:translocation/assembly module TamB domain-containing protein [Methylomagnum ishizawai]SMF95511.1 autotransporter secretion inner membrane protein TamB [Methylomagnum ishizawai]